MKYCLSSRQSAEYLAKADEIQVEYRDRHSIPDLAVKYPEATIVLQFLPSQTKDDPIDWAEINEYNVVAQQKFICCLADLNDVPNCKKYDIKFYWGYPVESFYELQGLKRMGVCYVRLGTTLFFSLDAVKKIGVPARAVPNVAYNGYIPQPHGVYGQWIRPEDVSIYEEYIDTLEFEDADLIKEAALYRIYSKNGWPGNLNTLITNLNYDVTSSLIPQETIMARLNCEQKCQKGSHCTLCVRSFIFADKDKLHAYASEHNLL